MWVYSYTGPITVYKEVGIARRGVNLQQQQRSA